MENRNFSPSTARNRAPILAVMRRAFPKTATVLEVASGTGEHVVFFAAAMPGLIWQPSDPDAAARASIAGWIEHENLPNVLPPLDIDVREQDWKADGPYDVLVAINMIHFSPWDTTLGLFAGAARLLKPGGLIFLYGPYKRKGRHTAPSNEAFDRRLKVLAPSYGVRDLERVEAVAAANGFALKKILEMPVNNLSVIFAR